MAEEYKVLSREAVELAQEGDLSAALKVAADALEANPDAIDSLIQVMESVNRAALREGNATNYGVAIVLTREKLQLLDALRNRVLKDQAASGAGTSRFTNMRMEQIRISRTEVITPLLAIAKAVKTNAKFTGRTKWWEYVVFPWVVAKWIYQWGDDEEGQRTALCLYTMIGELKPWMSPAQTEAWESAVDDLKEEAEGGPLDPNEWKSWEEEANRCAALRLSGELR